MLSLASLSTTAFVAPAPPRAALRQAKMTASLEEAAFDGKAFAQTLNGITEPVGFFDPAGFCSQEGITEGKVRFYREVELKHGRLAMLAAVGFPLAEQWHPLFNTDDAPSYLAFQQSPLETFWPLVVLAISIAETYSVFTFEDPAGGQPWAVRSDHAPGDFGFDPIDYKSTEDFDFDTMQTREINNGRLAMIGIAGMVVQELVTGAKLF